MAAIEQHRIDQQRIEQQRSAGREFESASRLAAIVESSADAIIGKTLDGTITSWNAGAERIYGYAAHEVIGRSIAVIVPSDHLDELHAWMALVATGERVDEHETKRVHKDGTILDVATTISPIRGPDGTVIGCAALARNITERKLLEAEHRVLQDHVHHAQRLESLGQLAGGLAHDFNNLLAVILNASSLLAARTTGDPAAEAEVAQIRAAAEQAAGLARRLMVFGRRDKVTLEVLDINVVVDDIEKLLARSMGNQVELVIEGSPTPVLVKADRGQIEQVLLNLAVNARDAMPSGGTMTIATRMTVLDDEYARFHAEAHAGPHVELSMSDTGAGMSREVMARAFEPFYTTKPTGQGTGLGLAMVHGIVMQAHGSVTVSSEEDAGTTVRIYLPAVSGDDTAPPA